jgi:broad specificity phosphatase PhoE
MNSILIVRHGPPSIDRDTAASSWELSEEGEMAVRSLGRRLDITGRSVVSSAEPKAVRTAELLNPAVHTIDLRLNEVGRPPGWVDDYQDRAVRYLGGQPVHGWEPFAHVVARMLDAVSDAGNFCHACFSGEYSAPLHDLERGYAVTPCAAAVLEKSAANRISRFFFMLCPHS